MSWRRRTGRRKQRYISCPFFKRLHSYRDLQKLQELIRRGTPKDLAAAQELMKIMSGAVRSMS
jgi:hypothetical protein